MNLPMNPPPKGAWGLRPAFTVVELLITIAIIAVLAALIFIGVGRGRESARAALCVNNMKQIATNHVLLAEENGGFLVHPWASALRGSGIRHWSEFHTILLSEDFGWDQPEPDVNVRMRTIDQFQCPTAYARKKKQMKEHDDQRGWRTYGLNQKIGVVDDPAAADLGWTDGALTIAEVESPTKLVLVSEAEWEGAKSRYPGAIGPAPGNTSYAHFHNGGFHVGYLDGHVEKHTTDTLLRTGRTLPNGQVGQWSNPEFTLMWRGRLTPRNLGDEE